MRFVEEFTPNKLDDTVVFDDYLIQRAREWLSECDRSVSNVCTLWDTDTDGSMSGCISSTLLTNNCPNIVQFNYMHKTKVHGLNNKLITFVLKNSCSLLICVDCGSSDYPYIKALTDRGVKVIVLDHHLVEGIDLYLSNDKVLLVNASLMKGYEELSGAMVTLQFLSQVFNDNKSKDKLMELAILSIVSDVCDTKGINRNFMNNYLYGHYEFNQDFRVIQNRHSMDRNFLISLASKFNSFIRFYGPQAFMLLLQDTRGGMLTRTDFMAVKQKDKRRMELLNTHVRMFEFENIVIGVINDTEKFMEEHNVRNYLGIIANGIARRKSKLCLIMMPSKYDLESNNADTVFTFSARDFVNRNSIEVLRKFGITSNGHSVAFGGTIGRGFSYNSLPEIDKELATLQYIEDDFIIDVDDIVDYVENNRSTVEYIGINNSILKERIVIRGNLRGYVKSYTYHKEVRHGDFRFKTYSDNINLYSKVKIVPTFNGIELSFLLEPE